MNFFPAFIDLYDKNVVVCGNNHETLVKVKKVMEFGAKVHLFSKEPPEVTDEVTVHKKAFEREDFSLNPVFVITSDTKEENTRVSQLCREAHILCNAVDQPEDCDFYFPSYYNTESMCVAVSTGGKSPTAAIKIKNEIKNIVPDSIDEILDWAVEIRGELKKRFPDSTEVKKILKRLVEKAIDEKRILTGDETEKIICEG